MNEPTTGQTLAAVETYDCPYCHAPPFQACYERGVGLRAFPHRARWQRHSLAAFIAACRGPYSEPGLDRLSALGALLGGLEEEGYGPETTDPDATWETLRECRALLDGLRAAMREAGSPASE